MANFTALKTAINNAIKTNGNEEITGAILQAILDAMVETLGDSAITDLENAITTEVTNRENAVGDVAADLAAEALARANKDNQLDNRINQEEYNRQNADAALSQTMSQGFQTLGSQMTALNAAISALNAAYQNGYLYGGIATPSSSPSNNKCFYIALQGGVYTNFGGVGVVEGINIIKNDNGWKVEHIYDQTTLLNEFYLLRQQVIQAITSFAPIVIEGDVTNAPDEEDLTSNANHLLQFKNNAYSPLEFSGLGRKYLRKNIAPLSESAPFNGFVEGVTAEETLSGTPTQIFWDRMNTRFVGIKDGVYYLDWTGSDNYVPVSTSLVYMYNGTPYQWDGSDFIVDETEVPNLVNCLTQDMINETNTIYIIRYDYTLKEDITIPANCVLQFDGGSISGAFTLTLQNTLIKGEPNINVVLSGICANNKVYAEWFGIKSGSDNANSNDTIFSSYIIPSLENIGGTLAIKSISIIYFNLPLQFNGSYNLDFKGELHYCGSYSSTAVTVGNSSGQSRFKTFNISWLNSENVDFYDEDNIPEFIGLRLYHLKNCVINIGHIKNFAYCLQLYSSATACASNEIYLNVIDGFFYAGIYLLSEGTGWTNENVFYCGTISTANQNPYKVDHSCIGILLEAKGTYYINGNYFVKSSLENNSNAIVCKKASLNKFDTVRLTNVEKSFLCDIDCMNNIVIYTDSVDAGISHIIGGRNNILTSIYEDEYATIFNKYVDRNVIDTNKYFSRNFVSASVYGEIGVSVFADNALVGVVVDVVSSDNILNLFARTENVPSGTSTSFYFFILDSNNYPISIPNISDYIRGDIGTVSYDSTHKCIKGTSDAKENTISFKDTVSKVLILFGGYTKSLYIKGRGIVLNNPIQHLGKDYIKVISPMSGLWFSGANYQNTIGGYTLELNADIDMTNKSGSVTLANNLTIVCKGGKIKNGTIALNGAKILPSYNDLVDNNSSLIITGMPAAGTLYWQNGKPTWSNGTNWVDATGATV